MGEIVSEEVLKNVASIIGEHSAAAKALADIKERREQGEDPVCVKINNTLYVIDRKEFNDE